MHAIARDDSRMVAFALPEKKGRDCSVTAVGRRMRTVFHHHGTPLTGAVDFAGRVYPWATHHLARRAGADHSCRRHGLSALARTGVGFTSLYGAHEVAVSAMFAAGLHRLRCCSRRGPSATWLSALPRAHLLLAELWG